MTPAKSLRKNARITALSFWALSSLSISAAQDIATVESANVISPDSVNLSAGTFLASLTNQDRAVHKAARMYLLGVEDATEGKSWCSYRRFKSISLREFIYGYMKKLPPERMSDRASAVIEEALRKYFPCNKGRPRSRNSTLSSAITTRAMN